MKLLVSERSGRGWFSGIWQVAACVFFVLALLPASALAQLTAGTITGTIVDESKATVPGAAVTIKNVETGLTRTVFTNERGFYEAPNLPVGLYEVNVVLQGFGTATRKDIQLAVGRNIVVDLTLAVGTLAQEVTVTGEAPLIETTTATVSNLINSKQVEDLPLVNRDLTQLTFLQPGVVKIPSSGSQGVFSGMGDKFTVAGARGTQNLYLLDGVSNADLSGNAQGASGSYMGSETVQEIQIVTNNYSAEYRSAAGGIVSAITKSGTNTLKGSAFEFFRNDSLDAANYFDKKFNRPKSPFERHQYGGALGGPIVRNKLFFFGSYEGLIEDRTTPDTATVLSVNARQGRLANGTTFTVNPKVVPYLALWPTPGQGNTIVQDFGDTVLIAGEQQIPTRNNFALGKLDFNLAENHTLSATYNFDKGHRSPYGLMGDSGAYGTESLKHVVSTKFTSVLGRSAVNELNVGYSDSRPSGDIPLSTVDFSNLTFRSNRTRPGEINISGVTGAGYRVDASYYRQRAYTLKEGYSTTRGNHSLRAGGEWTYYRYDVVSCSRGCNGVWEFRSISDFLKDANPRRFDILLEGGFESPRDLRQHLAAGYAQDNWRVKPNFTLNLGLRYEFASVPRETSGKISNLVNFTDKEVTVGVLFKNPTTKSFSPRVGMVWTPGDGKMSIRGGFGVFYEHPMLYNIRTSLQELPPFNLSGRIEGSGIDFPNAFYTQLARASGRPNLRSMEYDLDQTTYYRWNATVQRQLGTKWAVTVDYTATRGFNLWQQSLPNLKRWEGWPEQPPAGTPKYFPPNAEFINPNFGEMRIQYANAHLWYDGGSVSLQRRLDKGFQMGAAFTYSKAEDEGSGVTSGGDELPQSQRGIYAWDLHLKRGPSAYDIRKVFSANLSYELPFAKNATGIARVLGAGWQINSVISLSDGYALTVTEESAAQTTRIGDDEELRPDLVPGGNPNPVTGDPERWFDISQFTPSKLGYFGTLGRGTVTSPGLATVDLSLFKNFAIHNSRLQFRLETFNLLDRANFGTPDMTAFINGEPNPTAGRITSTRTPGRQMQLGARWTF